MPDPTSVSPRDDLDKVFHLLMGMRGVYCLVLLGCWVSIKSVFMVRTGITSLYDFSCSYQSVSSCYDYRLLLLLLELLLSFFLLFYFILISVSLLLS